MPTLLTSPPAATLAPKLGGAVLVSKVGDAALSYALPPAAPSTPVAVVGSALVGTATVG